MPNSTLALFRREDAGNVYRDPANPSFQVRIKATSQQKTVDAIRSTNLVQEIIVTDAFQTASDINGESFADPLSVRIKLSGSPNSVPRLAQILHSVADQAELWMTSEHSMLGFEITTMPINPGV